jgi:RNA polymerase sigma-70 factor (ECF subfamily)
MPETKTDQAGDPPEAKGAFPRTRWSMVLAAGGEGSTEEAASALEILCRRYWLPVYVTARSWGRSAEDAEDLTQTFFMTLIRRSALGRTSPEQGRFRSFLLKSLKNFLINDWRDRNRQKRGGGEPVISIDRDLGEERFEGIAGREMEPDRLFERQWATELLERTMRQLERLCREEGKERLFELLRPHLAGTEREGAYRTIAGELGISESGVRMAMFRMRERFRRLLHEEIRETVDDEASVEDEIRYLFRIFAPGREQ